jgi:hypothetical protein
MWLMQIWVCFVKPSCPDVCPITPQAFGSPAPRLDHARHPRRPARRPVQATCGLPRNSDRRRRHSSDSARASSGRGRVRVRRRRGTTASDLPIDRHIAASRKTPHQEQTSRPSKRCYSIKVVRKYNDLLLLVEVPIFYNVLRPVGRRRLVGGCRNAATNSLQKAFGFWTATCIRPPTGKSWPVQSCGDWGST